MPNEPDDLTIAWRTIELAGTLRVPPGDGPHPLMLMLQGSGRADRNSGGYFDGIRRAFLDRGIATFSADKPGCGASTGDWREHDLAARADQAVAVLDVLAGRPELDPRRFAVWGQSQGGWIVQQIAARHAPLAAAIANSGPSIGVVEQDLYAHEHVRRAAGFADDDVGEALALTERLHDAARRGVEFDELVRRELRWVEDRPWYRAAPIVDDALDWELFRRFVDEAYDPVAALGSIACPFLAVFGGCDVLLPAWGCAEEAGRALARSSQPDVSVVVFPTGDHRIQTDGAFVDGYLDLLGTWAAARLSAG